jgi:hypothetical protein
VTGDRRALFPISLSNQAFSTENVLPLLQQLFAEYDRVIFLVADQLQIYNRALRIGEATQLRDLIRDFDENQQYLEQRTRWLERLTEAMPTPIDQTQWDVVGIDELADAQTYRIFRNVMLTYHAEPEFRKDVNDAARLHAINRDYGISLDRSEQLSRGYLLEEIVISVRLHVVEGIRDEFYIGEQALPVLRLYRGEYGIMPEDLAQVDQAESGHRFFTLAKPGSQDLWSLAST